MVFYPLSIEHVRHKTHSWRIRSNTRSAFSTGNSIHFFKDSDCSKPSAHSCERADRLPFVVARKCMATTYRIGRQTCSKHIACREAHAADPRSSGTWQAAFNSTQSCQCGRAGTAGHSRELPRFSCCRTQIRFDCRRRSRLCGALATHCLERVYLRRNAHVPEENRCTFYLINFAMPGSEGAVSA